MMGTRSSLFAVALFALVPVGCGGVEPHPDAGANLDAAPARDAATDAEADAAHDAAVEHDAAPELDAGLDAFVPPHPPVTDGQEADLVLGQPDFVSVAAGAGQSGLSAPVGLGADGTAIWVGDGGNNRVLRWDVAAAVDGDPASLVIGQSGFDAADSGPSQSLIGRGGVVDFVRLFAQRTRLLVSDSTNNRLLVWNRLPVVNGAPAGLVLGQTSFDTGDEALGADGLSGPGGVWTDGTTLLVCNRNAHRVLLWQHWPIENGAPADLVLGQAAFDTADLPDPPTASSMGNPVGVFFDGEKLFVADSLNNRVLVWNGMPAADGQAADFVIGQTDLVTGLPNGGGPVGPAGMSGPTAVLVASGSLFVADTTNRRVLVFTPVPEESGVEASAVLGHADLASGDLEPPGPATMGRPQGMTAVDDQLFVVDRDWNRVLRYALDP